MQQFSQKNKLLTKISFTPKEKEIFDCFKEFVQETKMDSQLRVAGGWVRDKLLAQESHDIDIALDKMMGADFVKLMNTYMEQKYGQKGSGFGVTKFNPDKSKHLETACVNIKDVWIDIVNLRGETYSENSRIPQMTIGTPKQDAERRDLTINALFYNLMTDEVEDLTGKGLSDLENGIIRTPLEPTQTFRDDPLRVLRTIRFAARFGYEMVPEIQESLTKEEIRENLRNKVSKERIGTEVDKMLNHPSTFKSLQLFYKNNLWELIFEVPKQANLSQEKINELNMISYNISQTVHERLQILEHCKILNSKFDLQQIRFYAFLSAICYPFQNVKYKQNKNMIPVAFYILSESLKFTKKETTQTQLLITQSQLLSKLLEPNLQNHFDSIVRWIQESGPMWELAVFLCSCAENHHGLEQFVQFVYEKGLQEFYDVKPLLNGNEVAQIVGIKPGPEFKQILQNILLWQARYPLGTKEDLIQELKENIKFFQKQ